MKRKLGILAIALTALTTFSLLSGCGLGSPTQDNSSASGQSSTTNSTGQSGAAGTQEGLPATFTAYNNSYTIDSFTLEVNEDGNTVVVCEGSGFTRLPMRNNAFQMPISCILVVNGGEVSWMSGSASASGCEFEYEGELQPETLIFIAGDDESQRVEVPVGA